MSCILTSGAILRLLSADPADSFTQWIEASQIRPYVAALTMAQVLDTIRMDEEVTKGDRTIFERRYEHLVIDLQADKRRSILSATFDLKSAAILADLIGITTADDVITDMDLVPAAIALQHSLDLVTVSNAKAWEDINAAIQRNSIGRLTLRPFPAVKQSE